VELAALDCAIKLGLSHGGFVSRGKRNEDGRLPDHYQLEELRAVGLQRAIEKNVGDADGVLIISRGLKSDTTQLAVRIALEKERQLLSIDLEQYPMFEAASLIGSWISQKQIKVVFITGPAASQDPLIYEQTKKILETAFYLSFVKTGLGNEPGQLRMEYQEQLDSAYPQSVAEAVTRLKTALSLKDRATLANMQVAELDHLRLGLGEYVKKHFGLYGDNKTLLSSCAAVGGLKQPLADEACSVILRALWEDLRQTHRLRVIK
jgi:hypothetical protein